jgi:hypothetical protein
MKRIKDNLNPNYISITAKIWWIVQVTADRETTLKIGHISSRIKDKIKKELGNETYAL